MQYIYIYQCCQDTCRREAWTLLPWFWWHGPKPLNPLSHSASGSRICFGIWVSEGCPHPPRESPVHSGHPAAPGVTAWLLIQCPPHHSLACGHFPVLLMQTWSTAAVAEPGWRWGHRGDFSWSHQIMDLPSMTGLIFLFFCCISPSHGVSLKVNEHNSSGSNRFAGKQLKLRGFFFLILGKPPWKKIHGD